MDFRFSGLDYDLFDVLSQEPAVHSLTPFLLSPGPLSSAEITSALAAFRAALPSLVSFYFAIFTPVFRNSTLIPRVQVKFRNKFTARSLSELAFRWFNSLRRLKGMIPKKSVTRAWDTVIPATLDPHVSPLFIFIASLTQALLVFLLPANRLRIPHSAVRS